MHYSSVAIWPKFSFVRSGGLETVWWGIWTSAMDSRLLRYNYYLHHWATLGPSLALRVLSLGQFFHNHQIIMCNLQRSDCGFCAATAAAAV